LCALFGRSAITLQGSSRGLLWTMLVCWVMLRPLACTLYSYSNGKEIMPSPIAHFAVGAAIALPFTALRNFSAEVRPAGLIVAAGLLAASPDIDMLFSRLIPYSHLFEHRGISHSLFFLVCLSFLYSGFVYSLSRSMLVREWLTLMLVFALAAVSHPILDAMGGGGRGVMLLYPWSEERQLLPWRLFDSLPPHYGRLTSHGLWLLLGAELPLAISCLITGFVLRWIIAYGSGIKRSMPTGPVCRVEAPRDSKGRERI